MAFHSQMFADDIPLPRGNAANWASIIVMLASFTYMFFSTEVKIIAQQIVFQLFISFLAGSMVRLCEFLEECRHIPSRYKNGWMALNASFNLKGYGCGIVMFILFYCIIHEDKIGGVDFPSSLAWKINLCCFCYAFLKVFGFLNPTPAEISDICEKNKFNVAHGLAWSYYIGYLKFILPNLEERIKKYQCSVKNVPDCKENWKLYILIPFSCKIHDKLEKVDSRIEFFGNLPEICIDKAGIKARSYKNSIYAIYDQEDRPHRCILEYATPLRSLFEMSNDASAAFSKEQCLEQAKLFYVALENILNNSQECAGYFRLIPYNDDLEEGSMDSHFLSTKILKHLVQERMEYTVPEQTTWNEILSEDQLMISKSDGPQPLQSMNH
ncbi:stimulator of interferon genes protein isoform X1 [Carcharodon carcharias]|uniref:stimulator of interferon genes protein isoform X1 n=1 Tax=Carcharodon carcharias TaxID=13397 RepID=UPI001B7ED703|nr:stimulator of interferon genes protein isoform X1 [Carcharodon carcharias]XP_041050433.1 stimulator of interferon genes protein isoform X1 [Carcharodon carcharias]XP_041050434.1 stimulator of interferon genes protein isoform X1 [Carcharodon carcharias]